MRNILIPIDGTVKISLYCSLRKYRKLKEKGMKFSLGSMPKQMADDFYNKLR